MDNNKDMDKDKDIIEFELDGTTFARLVDKRLKELAKKGELSDEFLLRHPELVLD